MSRIKIDWAKIDGVKADFVKGEVKIVLRVSLETGLAIRGDLIEIADADQQVSVEIRPFQSKLPLMDNVTSVKFEHIAPNGEVLKSITLDASE